MRYVTNIKLNQLIIHMLDTKGSNGLVLSERTIPLEGNINLVDYFIGHIQNSLQHSTTKAASFVAIDSGLTSGICKDLLQDRYLFSWDKIPGEDTGKLIDFLNQNYNVDWIDTGKVYKMDDGKTIKIVSGNNSLSLVLNSEKTQVNLVIGDNSITELTVKTENGILKLYRSCLDLVEGSRLLAKKLYDIISKDKRIKACDLAVCYYQAENQSGISRYLALLNIEPSEVFRHKKERDPLGRLYINFEVDTEAMPTLGEKLQKCVFIRQLDPRPEYDMMLLDRQKQGKEVAKFFIDEFMGAKPTFDARQRTTNLYRGLKIARNKILSELQPKEIEYLDQATQVVVKSENINIDTWINSLSLSEKHKQIIEQELSMNLPDREFEIDKDYFMKLTRKRRFSGDGGLKITIEADKYDKVIKLVEPIRGSGSHSYYRIEIHTEEWKEVP